MFQAGGQPALRNARLPALLDDGRVVYSRWEYTDKPLWRIQSLWTTNPDGTNTAVVWGNQSVWPDHLAQPRQIPGTQPGVGLAGILRIESFTAEEITEPFKWHNRPEVTPETYTAKYATLRPMTALSYRSPLIELVLNGQHHDVKVDPVSLQRLIAWVDAMGPYRGQEEIHKIPDPEFDGIQELAIRPRTQSAPVVSRP